jgi:hypothetical protein
MKIKMKIFLFLALTLFISSQSFAQRYDENGYPIYKEMSEEDAQRILGDMYSPKFFKVNGETRYVKESIINGNKITTILFNYASICEPNRLGNIADLVWNGLGYGFEFGPLAAAPVVGNDGSDLKIVSDSFIRSGQGDYDVAGDVKWGWLPKAGYVDTTEGQNEIARLGIADTDGDGKPDSWPDRWYNPEIGKYVWPAFLGDQASAHDEEVYYVVDDFTDREFDYSPSPSDSTIGGLGLDMEVRVLQFNNSLAEDIMFLVYQITNASEKKLEGAYFGMHGDPHVGGPSDYGDDRADFIDPFGESIQLNGVPQRARSMVYSWDDDGVGTAGRPTGYFGWKFLESPSNAIDNIDNDDDGLTDESPDNSAGNYIADVNVDPGRITDIDKFTAIYGAPKPRYSGDEDGDWDPTKDDIGIDGIGPDSENYPGADYGEGDGVPSQGWYSDVNGDGDYNIGEPVGDERLPGLKWAGSELNFGLRDISESDQVGLSSFHAAAYTNSDPNVPRNDPLMWQWLSSDSISADQELLSVGGDNIFNFGTGPLDLEVGETQRFSMAILFGNNIDHLILNAETSTRILESDYRFAKPPNKPNLSVVPGNGRVTLYWDDYAEESFDPFIRAFDFQGYKIYRSRDPKFQDVKTITDGFGNPFIGKGIAQFDVVDSLKGFHPVEYLGRGVKYDVGKNEGLVHEYVDSTVTNGITYYYALAAYDGGSIKFDIPPTETQTIIDVDPITTELTFDVNTAQAVPMGDVAGFVDAEAGIGGIPNQISGNSTGDVLIKIMEPQKVDNKLYSIEFSENDKYSVFDSTGIKDGFTSKDTVFVDLIKQNIRESSFVVTDAGGNVINPSNYILKADEGKIRGNNSGDLPVGEAFSAEYNYYPVFNSTLVNGSDANPVFDGMRLFVTNHKLDLSQTESDWDESVNTNIIDSVLWSTSNADYTGTPHVKYRADWEVRWLDLDTLADGSWKNIGDTSHIAAAGFPEILVPFSIVNISETDSLLNYVKGNYLVDETGSAKAKNGQWDWGEKILLRKTTPGAITEVSYLLIFSFPDTATHIIYDTTWVYNPDPKDTIFAVDYITSKTTKIDPILPKAGDRYYVRTDKPFQVGDKYSYTSSAADVNQVNVKAELDNINVVPNPYVAFSMAEEPGRLPEQRGGREIQFRNLPQECTIRIYTITGELVQEIYKNDYTSIAAWDLLSFEGHRIAYGVYIYHVEVPNVGEKIGRIGVIK